MPRASAIERFASSKRPLAVSHLTNGQQRQRCDGEEGTHLGLSGMNSIPIPRMSGHRKPMPTTVRHEPEPEISRVPIEMQSVSGSIGSLTPQP